MQKFFRALPNFKGKHRLGRFLFKKVIQQQQNVKIEGKWACTYFLPNIKESIAYEIFINGVYEKKTIEFLNKNLPENGVLLDLGCNIGAIAIPLCKRRKDITVIGVEASPFVYSYLEKNIEINELCNFKIIPGALLDISGVSLQFYSPQDKFGKGSFTNNFDGNPINVISKTLDDIVDENKLERVDVIKMDVEGYEAKVLQGGLKTLKNFNPQILFEFANWAEETAIGINAGDSQRILRGYGYNLYDFEKNLKPLLKILLHRCTLIWAVYKH